MNFGVYASAAIYCHYKISLAAVFVHRDIVFAAPLHQANISPLNQHSNISLFTRIEMLLKNRIIPDGPFLTILAF